MLRDILIIHILPYVIDALNVQALYVSGVPEYASLHKLFTQPIAEYKICDGYAYVRFMSWDDTLEVVQNRSKLVEVDSGVFQTIHLSYAFCAEKQLPITK